VIGGNDAKRLSAHDQQQTSNAQHPTSNAEFRGADRIIPISTRP
jgi:hypothetical protein